MILALDPSSTCTGYALLKPCCGIPDLVEPGLLKPSRSTDTALARIDSMVADLRDLLAEYKPTVVVIETPSGKVAGRKRGRMGGAGLSVYGMAVGHVRQVCVDAACRVECVDELTWTGSVPKARRTAQVAALYGDQYSPEQDPGGDAADAIGLGTWWIFREKHNGGSRGI